MKTPRAFVLGACAGVGVMVALLELRPVRAPAEPPVAARPSLDLPTQILAGVYPVGLATIEAVAEPVSGGAIESLGDADLLVLPGGSFHALDRAANAFRPIGLEAPVRAGSAEDGTEPPRFAAVRDLKMREAPGGVELVLSYARIGADGCVGVRVASTVVPREALRPGAADPGARWREIFRTVPCVPETERMKIFEAGGALAFDREGRLVLSVGAMGDDGPVESDGAFGAQEPAHPFGKVYRIDPSSGAAETLSIGHRNQDGVAVAADGAIWLVEHGPRGGDELNLIEAGGNYGWPLETAGTRYGGFDHPIDDTPGSHDRPDLYTPPVHVWTPSFGPSGLEILRGDEFPLWAGDLLVSTLRGRGLLRVRLDGTRVRTVEPLVLGARIRDVAVDATGAILAMADRLPVVIRLTNDLEAAGAPGSALVYCAGCHQVEPADPPGDRAGPSLVGIVGAPVARDPRFPYSPALAALGGVWNERRLIAYLFDPQAVAPGTTMPRLDMKTWEIERIVAALGAAPPGGPTARR